jgi:hypothetical protein
MASKPKPPTVPTATANPFKETALKGAKKKAAKPLVVGGNLADEQRPVKTPRYEGVPSSVVSGGSLVDINDYNREAGRHRAAMDLQVRNVRNKVLNDHIAKVNAAVDPATKLPLSNDLKRKAIGAFNPDNHPDVIAAKTDTDEEHFRYREQLRNAIWSPENLAQNQANRAVVRSISNLKTQRIIDRSKDWMGKNPGRSILGPTDGSRPTLNSPAKSAGPLEPYVPPTPVTDPVEIARAKFKDFDWLHSMIKDGSYPSPGMKHHLTGKTLEQHMSKYFTPEETNKIINDYSMRRGLLKQKDRAAPTVNGAPVPKTEDTGTDFSLSNSSIIGGVPGERAIPGRFNSETMQEIAQTKAEKEAAKKDPVSRELRRRESARKRGLRQTQAEIAGSSQSFEPTSSGKVDGKSVQPSKGSKPQTVNKQNPFRSLAEPSAQE